MTEKRLLATLSIKIRPGRKRAAFGVDAAIMIGFIFAMMAILAAIAPTIISSIAGSLMGGSKGIYSLMVELPTWDPYNPSARPPEDATAARWVGWAAGSFYGLLQNVGLALLAVVLIIAAMCYIFETFRFMSEGTAMNIIVNSAFTLIVIFAIPYIYNGVATMINIFTGWPEVGGAGIVIKDGTEIDSLIWAMGGGVLGWEDIIARFFGSIAIFIISVSVLLLSLMMGAARLLIIGCLAAALPILLMLRLIPPTRHLADSLIETVIGIMFASIIAAIIIHFGFLLVSATGLSNIAKMVIALATFSGAAYMSTLFAGRLGGLFTTMGHMASTAAGIATGLTLTAAGMGAGALTGGTASLISAWRSGLLKSGAVSPIEALKAGALSGTLRAAAAGLPGAVLGASPTRVVRASAAAMPGTYLATKAFLAKRAGTAAESLLYHFAATPVPAESDHLGLEWYRTAIEGKPNRAIGELIASKTGLPLDMEFTGEEAKRFLSDIKDSPKLLYRIKRGLEEFAAKPEDEKMKILKDAVSGREKNLKAIQTILGRPFYDPRFELMDKDSSFYENILSRGAVGKKGEAAKAVTYDLIHSNYDPNKLDAARGQQFYRSIVFDEAGKRKSDLEIGRWIKETFNLQATDKEAGVIGHEYKRLLDKLAVDNPLFLDALAKGVEKTKASGGLGADGLNRAIGGLEKNTGWIKRYAEAKPGRGHKMFWKLVDLESAPGSSFTNFWDMVEGGGRRGGGGAPPQGRELEKRKFDFHDPKDHAELGKIFGLESEKNEKT
ncbi:MAG: hypothetical protein QXO15_00295 [Nitrososphaerota archaeon]